MRTYGESCGIAHGFDLIGDRWAGLVLRELVLGPKRFNDLAADLPSASASVLSERLRDLVAHGLVARRPSGPPARVQLYELTRWGAGLRPILVALGDWALSSPAIDRTAPLSDDAAALALAEHFTGGPPDWNAEYELRIGRGIFTARIVAGQLNLTRGAAQSPDGVLTTEAKAFTELLGSTPRQRTSKRQLIGEARGLHRLLSAVSFSIRS